MVMEVMIISSDGENVSVCYPGDNKGIPLASSPVSVPNDALLKNYHYTQLPPKYAKRYAYASRFVRLVQSKTPKVTLYTEEAKCMLMEDFPEASFEVFFYSDGAKVSRRQGQDQVIRKDGTCTVVPIGGSTGLSVEEQKMWNKAVNYQHKCLKIEAKLSAISTTDFSAFPVIVGNRPSSRSALSQSIFDASTVSSITASSLQSSFSSSSCSSPPPSDKPCVLHAAFIPGVGWATQLSNEIVQVNFLDGTQLSFQDSPLLVSITDVQGKLTKYTEANHMPQHVYTLLNKLPMVMTSLQNAAISLRKSKQHMTSH